MRIDIKELERLADEIQKEWQSGGLFDGIYRDFFLELINRLDVSFIQHTQPAEESPQWKVIGFLKFDPAQYQPYLSKAEYDALLPLQNIQQNELWMTGDYLTTPFVRLKSSSMQVGVNDSGDNFEKNMHTVTWKTVSHLNARGIFGDVIFGYVKWTLHTSAEIECVAFVKKSSAIRSVK